MLIELYLLETYFEETAGSVREEDLVARFGLSAVREALADRLIERRCIPCAHGQERFLCRLSRAGLAAVTAENRVCTTAERVGSMGWV